MQLCSQVFTICTYLHHTCTVVPGKNVSNSKVGTALGNKTTEGDIPGYHNLTRLGWASLANFFVTWNKKQLKSES